ncbi:MAG: phosphoribosylanthranilate isomerase, partial [Bacteroidetes bacterium]
MEQRLMIKVCGMRDRGNLQKVCLLGPDMVGYIFFGGSKRYVGEDPDPGIFEIPGRDILKVGVFVNDTPENVRRIFLKYGLDLVQLHGDETPEYCGILSGSGVPVIRAMDPAKIAGRVPGAYSGTVRYFLFDTPGKGYGGTGRQFDWD